MRFQDKTLSKNILYMSLSILMISMKKNIDKLKNLILMLKSGEKPAPILRKCLEHNNKIMEDTEELKGIIKNKLSDK